MNATNNDKTLIKAFWAIAAVLAVFWYAPTRAVDAPPAAPVKAATIGTGTFSCERFTKYDHTKNNSEQMDLLVQWAWGFMSAYNNRAAFAETFQENDAPSPITPPNAATTLAFIRKHCEQNPQSNVVNATLDLISTAGGIVTSSISLT